MTQTGAGTMEHCESADVPGQQPMSLHIGITYALGGEGRVVSELMQNLPNAGFGFKGIVDGPDGTAALTGNRMRSFAPAQASLLRRLSGVRQEVRKELRETRPSIVASHFALYTIPALNQIRNVGLVSHFHGPWSSESIEAGDRRMTGYVKQRLEGIVYRRADRVIVLSRAFGDLAVRMFAIDPSKLRMVPGCVQVERFAICATRDESREILALPKDRFILLSIRRLVRRMGLQNLIGAMPDIVAKFPEVLLCIGGRGPMLAELTAQVDRLGLAGNVKFLGFVDEEKLPHLYRAANVNVVPSQALEGFGLVAAEALAAGTPSMVTPVGGLPEVVSALSPTLIFRSSSPTDIGEGLIEAIHHPASLPDAAQCREFAAANFTSQRMAERTAGVYRELL